ncbi:MAG: Ig-like domain-containing protein, partial [Limisphaerales bacterium]
TGSAQGIHVVDSTAFVAVGRQGLAMVDVGDPLQPVLLGRMALPGDCFEVAFSVEHGVAGVLARAEDFSAGEIGLLHFVDLRNPVEPRLIQTYSLPVTDIQAADGLFYVALGQFVAKEVRIYDPASALELGWFACQDFINGLLVAEGRAYVATQSGLEIFDPTLPSPQRLGRLAASFPRPDVLGRVSLMKEGTVVWVGRSGGAMTVDVSDPAAPSLIAQPEERLPSVRSLALNGSGLIVALTTSSPTDNPQAAAVLALYGSTRQTNVNAFLFSLPALGQARDVALNAGLALIADGTAGLTIMNYLGADLNRQAPWIDFDPASLDADPARDGLQVVAGRRLALHPQVADDVQTDHAELIVDGAVVDRVSVFPVILTWTPEAIPQEGREINLVLQIRAVDRSGNVRQSAPLVVELLPDVQAPALLASLPAPNGAAFSDAPLVFRFEEPLDPVSLDPERVILLNLGTDGAVGGGDDSVGPPGTVEISDSTLSWSSSEPLPVGRYRLTIQAGAIADRSGNGLGSEAVFEFDVQAVHPGTGIWIGDQDGAFSDPANWLHGRVPQQEEVLIQRFGRTPEVTLDRGSILKRLTTATPIVVGDASFSVLRGWHALEPVLMPMGSAVLSGSNVFEKSLSLTGGRMQAEGRLEVQGRLSLNQGGSLTLSGLETQFVPAGGVEGTNFTFAVRDGAVIELPGFAAYDGPGDFTSLFPVGTQFRAQGPGSRLTLPDLITANGPVNWNVRGAPSLVLEAVSGGELQLPRLAELTGRTILRASGFGSTLQAPELGTVTGPDSAFLSAIEVANQGLLGGARLTNLVHCVTTLQSEGLLRGGSIELAESALLRGTGTLEADLVNRGSLVLDRVPGTLIIDGDLRLTAGSLVEVTLGLGAGRIDSGKLEVRGTTALDGTLKFTKASGYTPTVGQEFPVGIFANAPSGAFAQVDDTALGTGVKADAVVSAPELRVNLVSGP